jgi:hypothetical protein
MSFAETISATFKNQSEGDFSKASLLFMEAVQKKIAFAVISKIISFRRKIKKSLI